jgi:hypothetical protein
MTPTRIAALLAFALSGSAPAQAWGACGHRIVAEIADRHLDAATRVRTAALLGSRTLADVSVWADRVRETERFEWTRRLHYVNLPEDATSFDAQRDCPDGACVVRGIARFSAELASPDVGREGKILALKFLIHLVGDIHQPLHVSRKSDLGGNLITVIHRNERSSLHRVWDSGLLDCGRGEWNVRAVEIDRTLTASRIDALSASEPAAMPTPCPPPANSTRRILRGTAPWSRPDLPRPEFDWPGCSTACFQPGQSRARPHAMQATPKSRLAATPPGAIFSTQRNRVSTTIHNRFMTPRANDSAISPQQQPRQ